MVTATTEKNGNQVCINGVWYHTKNDGETWINSATKEPAGHLVNASIRFALEAKALKSLKKEHNSKELSNALTFAETAVMWLEKVQ